MATKKLSCEHFFHEILRVIRTSMTGCSAGHFVLFKALKRLVSWTAIFCVHRLTAWAGISSCLFYQSLCSKNRTSFHPPLSTMGAHLFTSHWTWILVRYCMYVFHCLYINNPYCAKKCGRRKETIFALFVMRTAKIASSCFYWLTTTSLYNIL